MKKHLFIALCLGLTVPLYAQKLPAKIVPKAVRDSFLANFPKTAKAQWELEKDQYEVSFEDTTEQSATFDLAGRLLEVETEIAIAELPEAALVYLKLHYPDVDIDEAARIVNASRVVTYEAEVKRKDILFDAQGNLIP